MILFHEWVRDKVTAEFCNSCTGVWYPCQLVTDLLCPLNASDIAQLQHTDRIPEGCDPYISEDHQCSRTWRHQDTNSGKYDLGWTYRRRRELHHWLDISERIQFRIVVTVRHCLNGLSPVYLSELCDPATQIIQTIQISSLVVIQ